MSRALDMSLDDIIKNNKKSGGGGGGFRRKGRISGGGPGPTRQVPNRAGARSNPYAPAGKASDSAWQHDMYADQAEASAGRVSAGIETRTKLYISNLEYGVSNEDIKELFSEVGDLKRFTVHYDRSGRSKGTAEVFFSRRADAIAAVKRYNNVQLDGKPMKIEIVGTNIAGPAVPQASNGSFGNPNGVPRSFPGRGGPNDLSRGGGANGLTRGGGVSGLSWGGGTNGLSRGGGPNGLSRGGGRGRGRGRGQGRGRSEPVSAADLDADLDKYHSEAMQIN